MGYYYIDEQTGEACYSERWSKKEEKEYEKARREKAKEYWDSLSQNAKEVISFCRTNPLAKKHCLAMAQVRERTIDQYWLFCHGKDKQVPKKEEKYAYVAQTLEQFKTYLKSLK